MSIDDLEAEALKLAPKDRAKLAGKLLESLEDLSPDEIGRLWTEEAARRDQDLDRDPAGAIPAADVLSKARSRLK